MNEVAEAERRVVLVSGLSGAGKSTILRALEDLGFETIDNPPATLIEDLVVRTDRALAIVVDARTRGFAAEGVLKTLDRLRRISGIRPELICARADMAALLRRYSETRHRHPLAPNGPIAEGIAAEEMLTAPLMAAADLVVDTTDLPQPALRRLIAQRFGPRAPASGLVVSLMSFAYPKGLPREADLVLDSRFLRNPHYDPVLRPRTGLDPAVAAHIEADPDYAIFHDKIVGLLDLVLPRFVQEGKTYATVAIGCTGGRHRSVHLIEKVGAHLVKAGWSVTITHRELAAGDVQPGAPAVAAGA